jgi:hypothetical protein
MKTRKYDDTISKTLGRVVWLEQNNSFIKIIDNCGDRLNNGLITVTKAKPVWLSLKKKGRSPNFLIGEIAAAGGDFLKQIGYESSRTGHAICDGGTGYEGGVPFEALDDALTYLAQYFDLRWCGEQSEEISPGNKSELECTVCKTTSHSGAVSENAHPFFCASLLLAHFSHHSSVPLHQFDNFYKGIKKCFGARSIVVKGEVAHSSANWPKKPGVYVVRDTRTREVYHSIVYVGMTGKLTHAATHIPGRLSKRPLRWNPYAFKKDGFHYGYRDKSKTYTHRLACCDYVVDCFVLDPRALAAPSFLESLILQAYSFVGLNRLPPANNAF